MKSNNTLDILTRETIIDTNIVIFKKIRDIVSVALNCETIDASGGMLMVPTSDT